MNPTDQARKEARKKELKKNKRQRQIVRTAVLRGKDPMQLLAEMEKIDQMEFNVLQPSPLNEKVLKDKRKKLRDTFDRVMKMYYKDDPEKWEEIRRAKTEYEKRRNTMLQYYEAVRHTQQVTVDEIPLPIPQMGSEVYGGLGSLPMPSDYGMLPPASYNSVLQPPPGILRKKSAYSPPPSPNRVAKRNKVPPGVPPGPPPELSGEEDEGFGEEITHEKGSESSLSENDSDQENLKSNKRRGRAIRFAESGSSDEENEKKKKSKSYSAVQDIDSFMKEAMEEVKRRKAEPFGEKKESFDKNVDGTSSVSLPGGQIPSGLPPAPPMGVPPPLMFRPPPMMMGPGGIRLPPGPPPGRPPALPPGPPPGLPPRLNSGIRMPPGMPPMMRYSSSNVSSSNPGTSNVVSAAPQLINRGSDDVTTGEEQTTKSSATIEAKAQMRNLNADVTRFLPTSVRVKRDDSKPKFKPDKKETIQMDVPKPLFNRPANPAPPTMQPSKDDAYMQFMKEMQGLL